MAITNGDFETGDLTGWNETETGTADMSVSVTSATKYEGTYSCKFLGASDPGEDGVLKIDQDITTTYNAIVFRYKIPTLSGDALLAVQVETEDYYASHTFTAQTTEWTYYVLDIVPVDDRNVTCSLQFYVSIGASASIEAYIDIVEETTPVQALTNAGFELGALTGWHEISTGGTTECDVTTDTPAPQAGTYCAYLYRWTE